MAALLDQVGHLGAHAQIKAGIMLPLLSNEIEKVPLRHQGQEPASSREMAQVGERNLFIADLHRKMIDLLVRQLEELVEQAQLVHYLQS